MKKLIVLLLILLLGCKPETQPAGMTKNSPELHDLYFLTEDSVQLPVHRWLPGSGKPRAVIIGVHGFNDYGNFLRRPAGFFSKQGIVTYTFDQRGFGAAPRQGYWAGRDTYAADLRSFVRTVKQRHPGLPVFLLGESMGGAIVIEAVTYGHMAKIDGIILVAPAIWPREIMPWYQTALLWLLAHTVPWMTFSGEGVGVMLSDNREMMREFDTDPLVLRQTRVEALHGLTDLMDSAFENASQLGGKILLLYGEKDEIIPKIAINAFLQGLYSSGDSGKTVIFYPDGYHLLLRDLKADIIWEDIVAWVLSDGHKTLPSNVNNRKSNLRSIMPPNAWQQG